MKTNTTNGLLVSFHHLTPVVIEERAVIKRCMLAGWDSRDTTNGHITPQGTDVTESGGFAYHLTNDATRLSRSSCRFAEVFGST